MRANIKLNDENFSIDLSKPIDISIPLKAGLDTVSAFYASPVHIAPVRAGDFVGDTQEGGVVNFKNVQFNPHGNGTHTECVGHISTGGETVNECIKQFFFLAELISVYPVKLANGDRVITQQQIADAFNNKLAQALVLRTLPNDDLKLRTNYSGSNPPYIHHEAITYMVQNGIEHLLLDLPSVDKEQDEGKLLAHKAFWQYPSKQVRLGCSITELIYVPNTVKDGTYFINLQFASLSLDASPSKPILYKLL